MKRVNRILVGLMLAWACAWALFATATYAVAERSSQWRKVRAAHLVVEPTCVFCGTRRDLEVHHVVPFAVDASKELDRKNLVTVCGRDHLAFCHLGSYRAWNPDVREHAAIYRGWVENRREQMK